jgi:cytidylate kinase
MAIITISRQFGSGGDEIAARLSMKLSYQIFDKRQIARAAHEIGLTGQDMIDFSEDDYKIQGLFDRLFNRTRPIAQVRIWKESPAGTRTFETELLDEEQATGLVQSAIRAAYRAGDTIILGRGGQVVLKDKPGVLHVRIEGPLEDRIERMADEVGITPDEARDSIMEHDRNAAEYLRRFHHEDWSNPLLYHLVINTGKVDIEDATQLIITAVSMIVAKEAAH